MISVVGEVELCKIVTDVFLCCVSDLYLTVHPTRGPSRTLPRTTHRTLLVSPRPPWVTMISTVVTRRCLCQGLPPVCLLSVCQCLPPVCLLSRQCLPHVCLLSLSVSAPCLSLYQCLPPVCLLSVNVCPLSVSSLCQCLPPVCLSVNVYPLSVSLCQCLPPVCLLSLNVCPPVCLLSVNVCPLSVSSLCQCLPLVCLLSHQCLPPVCLLSLSVSAPCLSPLSSFFLSLCFLFEYFPLCTNHLPFVEHLPLVQLPLRVVQLSSVEFKVVPMLSEKPICV